MKIFPGRNTAQVGTRFSVKCADISPAQELKVRLRGMDMGLVLFHKDKATLSQNQGKTKSLREKRKKNWVKPNQFN